MRAELELGGLTWRRDYDGTVIVTCRAIGTRRLRPEKWAEVVAHVSARGNTQLARQDATHVHKLGPIGEET